jgi:diguanylate cyclase
MQQRASKRSALPASERKVPGLDVLIFLAEQGLPPTPDNYSLAYRRASEQRGLVAKALDAIVMEGRGVTQADADRISALHAGRDAGGRDGVIEQQQEAIRLQALRLADLTAGAASGSSAFGNDLSARLRDLATGTGGIEQIVIAMVERTRGVEAELNAAASKID